MKLSVLQWNVLYQEKADNVLKLIEEVDADILCLQELTQTSTTNPNRDIPAQISKLGYFAYYEPSSNRPDLILGNGIFSKYPLSNQQKVHITREDPTNKDFPQYDRIYLESAVNIGETQLIVWTAHLSYSPGFVFFPAKKAEANKLLKDINHKRKSFLLTGDLNALPESFLIKKLDKLFTPAGPDYSEATFTTRPFELHGFKATGLDWRLDYIYVSPDLRVKSSKIIDTKYSDHLPILAKIEI